MEALHIQGAEFTPEIHLNPNTHEFLFEGVSRPENVTDFYSAVNEWIADYESHLYKNHVLGGKKFEIHIIFRFSYFNSASSKMIYTFLESLRRISMMGYIIVIDWYYEDGDDQMREDGEELSEAIDIQFNFKNQTV
jgi:hypothetical protein